MLSAPTAAAAHAGAEPENDRVERRGPDRPRDAIVVTGTAIPVQPEKLGHSLTVIEAEAIDLRRAAYLQDILRTVPGISVSQSGGPGGHSQVRIRGAESNHVLVLVDGIEVSSVGSGEFDFSALLADNIERIEVLRGPRSGQYGSNALAGVIQVITKRGAGPSLDGAAEYGAFDTRFARVGITGGDRETFVAASGAYRVTAGFSSATLGTERDGDRNLSLYLRGGVRLGQIARLDGMLRFVDKASETDGFDFSGGPLQGLAIDDESYANTRDWSGGASLTVEPAEAWTAVLTGAHFRGAATGGSGRTDTFGSEGARTTLAARSTVRFDAPSFGRSVHRLTLFVEREHEGYRNTFPTDPSQTRRLERNLLGYGAEYRLDLFDTLFLSGAIRRDDNDRFADATTFSLAASWVIGATRVHSSYGTGVTNPTFFEQFGFTPGTFVGNPDLHPEKARGFDLGVAQRLFDGRVWLDVTYFNSVLTDEIMDVFPTMENDPGESRREGAELSARIDLGGISLGGSYTLLDADDPDGTREVRRPANQASVDLGGRLGREGRASFSAGLIFNGRMLDTDYRDYFTNGFVSSTETLDSYTVVRFSASYRIGKTLELFGRVENALDARYEELLSYHSAPRAIHGGLRFVLP